jgi:rSAM/selenodomain-associated transferase 2
MRVSVLIPAVNESDRIGSVLRQTAAAFPGHEIIVVAAGDAVATVAAAATRGVAVVRSNATRGASLNEAARTASGDVLLFVHADTLLPSNAAAVITDTLANQTVVGGAFRLRFDDDSRMARVIETWVLARSLAFNVFLGDQTLFVRREVFLSAGGFRDWSLMEDLEILGRLRRFGRLRLVRASVVTSARRHVNRGWIRTTGLVWIVTCLYCCGVPTRVLTQWYRRGR